MTTDRPPGRQLVLFCNCVHYDVISLSARKQILDSLARSGIALEVVGDLCGLAANRDPRLREWAQAPSLAVVACFPRAIRWLFHAAGAPLSEDRVRFFNMRTQSPDEIIMGLLREDGGLRRTEKESAPSASNQQPTIINHQSDWIPWFPVIDYDRCANCKQCMNFCLFGVYGLSEEGRVTVQKPSGCKTNCPACARMCPRKAIIFPKYADPPINGDECSEEAIAQEQQRAQPDLRKLVAGDVYERIRSRTAGDKRFSTQTGDASRSCPTLESLKRELNIPDDVLASLSPAEIQRIIKQPASQPGADGAEKGEGRDE